MKKRTPLALLIILLVVVGISPLAALQNTEKVVQAFVNAFQEREGFSAIEHFFFTTQDIDALLALVRDSRRTETDPERLKKIDKLLKALQNPENRDKTEKEITQGVETARKRWQYMLAYPVDTGEKVLIDEIRITIKFKPMKYYEIRLQGHYKLNGQRQQFRIQADYFVLNGKVKIIKFR